LPHWWILVVVVLALGVAGCAAVEGEDGSEGRRPRTETGAEAVVHDEVDDAGEVRGAGHAPSHADRAADPRPYLSVRGQAGAALSAGGDRVVYLSGVTGMPQAWRLDSPLGWPRQVTHFADRATVVRWTTAPDRLLVSGDVGGDERDDLLTVNLDGGDAVTVARGDEGRNLPGGFTPDGASMVIASSRRHHAFFDLWVADLATGDGRMLHEHDSLNSAGEVSPDGTRVLTLRTHGSFEQELAVVDMETGERTRLLADEPLMNFENARWSQDGASVLVCTDRGRDFLSVLRLPLDGGEPEPLYAAEGDVDAMDVCPTTGWMAWTVNVRGSSRLEVWHPDHGGKPRVLLDGGRAGSPPRFASGVPVFVVGWGGATRPSSLLRVDLSVADPVVETLTEPDFGGLDPSTLVEPVEHRFASFDGVEISGFLFRPAEETRSCVVMVHGGPEGQYRHGYDPVVQLLLARGHAVFAPNVRGSMGYGRAFTRLDDGAKRMDSVDDLAAVHAWLVEEGVADADSIAVMGGSYGGYMVLSALTRQAELWAAGVDIVGMAHLGTFLKNTSEFRRPHRAAEYGDPVALAEFFEKTAPLNLADRIRAPLLVMQGKNDPRVPRSEAEQIVAACDRNGVDVQYLLFEDEGHGFAKLKNRLTAFGAAADFLDRVLCR